MLQNLLELSLLPSLFPFLSYLSSSILEKIKFCFLSQLNCICFGSRPHRCRNLSIPLQCRHGSWGTSAVSPGESVLVSSGGMHVRFPPELKSSVTLPYAWIKGSVPFPRGFPTRLSHEAFPRGFPTRLSHEAFSQGCPTMPPWCESILGFEVEAVQGKQVSLE